MSIDRLLSAVALAAAIGHGAVARAATGPAVPELAAYDREVEAFIARWNVPGAAVAVVRNGRLLFARGYGAADPLKQEPVQPDSLFRIASLSMPITSAAVMKLVEDGALALELPVFPYLGLGTPSDPRLNLITVRHLLEHSGGWDRAVAGDPPFMPRQIAQAMGVASPPDERTIVRWVLTQPLQYDPGTRFAYSNLGYIVLGLVVAKASGQTYADAVRTLLLRAGVTRMALGASLPAGRLAGEVRYAMDGASPDVPSVFDDAPGMVSAPYGGFALEPMAANGGWVASAVDLAAFLAAIDGQGSRADLLGAESLAETVKRPSYVPLYATAWSAKGWSANQNGEAWHQGSLPGTTSLLVRANNGTQWAVLMNLRNDSRRDEFAADLDDMMWNAYRSVTQWPVADLFPQFGNRGTAEGCFGVPAFAAGKLCLPVVEVPNGSATPDRYTATLALADAATLTFTLASAAPVANTEAGVPSFDPATGMITLPRVVVPDPSGTPRTYRARMQLVPGAAGMTFRVIEAVPQ
jgi:N-acyl-D-amino-acid deacylase